MIFKGERILKATFTGICKSGLKPKNSHQQYWRTDVWFAQPIVQLDSVYWGQGSCTVHFSVLVPS